MSESKIGPKEAQLRALREQRNQNKGKPSKADLRNKIAAIKPMTNKGGKRGR